MLILSSQQVELKVQENDYSIYKCNVIQNHKQHKI